MKLTRALVLLFLGFMILGIACFGLATAKKPHDDTPEPTELPTPEPTPDPTPEPTPEPTEAPTPEPTLPPSETPTPEPSIIPTEEPTPEPTIEPTISPTESPTSVIPVDTPVETTVPTDSAEPLVPTPIPASGSGGGGSGGGSFFFPTTSPVLSETWYSCDLRGAMISSSAGGQTILMERSVEDEIELTGNQIVFRNAGLQIRLETMETLNASDTVIHGTIRKATITTDPIIGEDRKKGIKFLAKVEAEYSEVPSTDSRIKMDLSTTPSEDLERRFQEGSEGFVLQDVSHTLSVETQNLDTPVTATIWMSVSPEWVTSWGRNSIHILRMAADGSVEVLDTETAGNDSFGNPVFAAVSSHGFSTFGLVSLLELSDPTPSPSLSPDNRSIAAMDIPILPVSGATGAIPVPWFMAPALVIVLMTEGVAYVYLISQSRKVR